MAYMKMDEIVIPVFDGAEYSSWKKRLLKFLEYKKCKEVAVRLRATTDKLEDWLEDEIKARNYLYSAVTNRQLEYVADLDTAYEILKKFDEMYIRESTALQIVRRENLENVKLKNYTDVTVFFDEFERAANELKAAGATVTEQEKLRYMLRALPQSHSYLGDLIDVLPAREKTVEYLKTKIKFKAMEEKTLTERKEENIDTQRSSVFVSDAKGRCFQCGKFGHYKRECNQQNYTGQREVPRGGLSHGGGYGRGRARGHGAQRGRYQRGSHRGFCGGRGRYRGTTNQVQQEHARGGDLFIAEVNALEVKREYGISKNKIKWILDSGCTDHIINDDSLFYEYIVLKEPISVKLCDGRSLQATKIGKVKTFFNEFNNNKNEITLLNVFYVRNMKQNLISFSKVTERNKIISYGDVSKIYNKRRELIATANKIGNLYHMTSTIDNRSPVEIKSNMIESSGNKMTLKERWHRVLGHVNFNSLNNLLRTNR